MPVPPQVPVIKFVSPNKADQALIEFWNTSLASYLPLDLGASYQGTRDFPGYRLGKQFNLPNDEKWVVRIWVTDQVDPTWHNWAEKFSGDANAFPIFVREYREPRKTYAPLTKGQPLKSIYRLSLATVGTGYTPGTLPALTFDNTATGGTGAAGHAIVAPDGTIADLVLDDGGSGYNSAPTFTIEAPASGTTATGTAVIQPATALLVAEEAQQFPEDSEFRGLFLNVVRVYETLPGPLLPDTRDDLLLGPVQRTRRAVLNTGQAALGVNPILSATGKTTYEARDGSNIVLWEIVETWSNGTGVGNNPAYPIYGPTTSEDEERGSVSTTSQMVVKTTPAQTATVTVSGGIATRTDYAKTNNPFLLEKIVSVSASIIVKRGMTEQYGGSETLIATTISTTELFPDLPDYGTIDSKVRTFANGWIKTTVNIDGADWPILYDYDIDPETGQTILSTYQVVDQSVAETATSVAGVVTRYKHIDAWRSMKIVTTYSTPAEYDEQRFGAHNFPALVDITTWSFSDGCGTIVEEFRGGFSAMVQMRTNISYTTTKQTIAGLTLIPKSFILGKYVQLPQDMLVDGDSLSFSGDCTGSITYTGSDPDYSTYVGSIQGTEQLVTGESVRTQSGLYRNTEVYVTML